MNACVFFPCQTMPVAMALLRDVQNLCPKDVLNFILDLIKYNDNRKNKVMNKHIKHTNILFCIFHEYITFGLFKIKLKHSEGFLISPSHHLCSVFR